MKIKFDGEVNLTEFFDDRGSVDIWLLSTIRDIIEKGPESDDIYKALKLSWDVVE